MRIFVASREWVRRAPHTKFADLFAGFWGVISITSYTHWDGQYETEVPESLEGRDNVLHLCFDDVTPENVKYNQFTCRLFDDKHAQQILTFIQRAIDEKAESILVHCDAGISRSGAVGTELNDYCNKYLKDDKNTWSMFYSAGCENHLRPNPHVSSLLRKHLYHQKEPMVYTTYIAQLKNLPDTIEPILITRWAPKFIKNIKTFKSLAPSEELLRAYKAGEILEQDYIQKYYKDVLSKLNPNEVRRKLFELSGGKDIALVCYEKPSDFCHRHIVNDWLNGDGEFQPIKK